MKPISRQQLASVVGGLYLNNQMRPDKLAKAVAAYMLDSRQINQLESLIRDIQKYWASRGYLNIVARVARPLPELVYLDMKQPFLKLYPNARQITVTPQLDHRVIGGVSLELAEQRLDISIERRLRRFKKVIKAKGI